MITCIIAGGVAAAGDTVAVFYALDADVAALRGEAPVSAPGALAAAGATSFPVGPHTVVAVQMGSGATTAGIAAGVVLALRPVARAFSLGPAGDLSGTIPQGTWLWVEQVRAWQAGADTRAWQMDGPGPTNAIPMLWLKDGGVTLASGEQFVASTTERRRVAEIAKAVLIDMNAMGVATACARFHVPLHLWRVVSDHADERAGEDFRAFATAYDGEGGRRLRALLLALPATDGEVLEYPAIRALLGPGDPAP